MVLFTWQSAKCKMNANDFKNDSFLKVVERVKSVKKEEKKIIFIEVLSKNKASAVLFSTLTANPTIGFFVYFYFPGAGL
jgi:hypothetical protein